MNPIRSGSYVDFGWQQASGRQEFRAGVVRAKDSRRKSPGERRSYCAGHRRQRRVSGSRSRYREPHVSAFHHSLEVKPQPGSEVAVP